ncbi:helix-turn-helix transcriptional regulator [Bradyrhizobium sp. KBS0727]|uniref:helix-turn-helix transcriptional regulator n=1 Tax=unclassified Bradyrhizobium TaxID=2631580 RepID=UPI00352D984F
MRRPEIKRVNPVADRTLEGAEAAGLFPKRILLSPKAPAWRRAEVEAWLRDPTAWVQRQRQIGSAATQ